MPSVAVAASPHSRISHLRRKKAWASWRRPSKGVCHMDEILTMLAEIGLPYAYHHFAEGESPDPPFICYLTPGSDNFAADGKVYYKIDEYHIELYTDVKSPTLEAELEAVLDAHGIFYDKTEVWIDSEKLYEVLYSFETED
jgi:hypothetical protein